MEVKEDENSGIPSSDLPKTEELKAAPSLLSCPFCGSDAESAGRSGNPPTLDEYLAQRPNVRCSNGRCGLRYIPGGMSFDEWNTRAANSHDALVAAGATVLAGLDARIKQASDAGLPVPVFDGIADLYAALTTQGEG